MYIEVSVIVPVYNAENTISKCIDSVLNQTFENYEVVLINDGSTDNSKIICQKYLKKDSRIKLLDQENSGVSSSRNAGLQAAQGKYIYFIDSDDWIESHLLDNLVRNSVKSELAICGYNRFLYNGMEYKFEKSISLRNETMKLDVYLNDLNRFYDRIVMQPLWNKLYRRNIIVENNIKFNDQLSLGEDILFNLDYLKHVKRISTVNSNLYNYVIFNEGKSLSTKFNKNRIYAQIKVYTEIEQLLSKNNLYNEKNKDYFDITFSKALVGAIKNFAIHSIDTYDNKKRYLRNLREEYHINNSIKIFRNGSMDKCLVAILFKLKFDIILIYALRLISYFK